MRFFYVKKEQPCQECKSTLSYNDEAVVLLVNFHGGKLPLVFHPECYLEWNAQMFIHRLETWRQGSTQRPPRRRKPKPKIGRPRKYTDPIKAGRLRSLAHYYQQEGLMDRAHMLLGELEELKL